MNLYPSQTQNCDVAGWQYAFAMDFLCSEATLDLCSNLWSRSARLLLWCTLQGMVHCDIHADPRRELRRGRWGEAHEGGDMADNGSGWLMLDSLTFENLSQMSGIFWSASW